LTIVRRIAYFHWYLADLLWSSFMGADLFTPFLGGNPKEYTGLTLIRGG